MDKMIELISELITEDPDLTYDDIGTDNDIGSMDSSDDGSYSENKSDSLDTFSGIAYASAEGILREKILGTPTENLPDLFSELVYSMLERSVADTGSIANAIESLSFRPTDDDIFFGSRLELKNGTIIGYNGYSDKQYTYKPKNKDDAIVNFVVIGTKVLTGMINILCSRS